MHTPQKKPGLGVAAAAALSVLLFATGAQSAAVIYNTGSEATATVALGVNDEGHLNVFDPTGAHATANVSGSGHFGLAYKFPDGMWYDATSPGCLCEGWGVSATVGGMAKSGFANVSTDGGVNNLSLDSFAPGMPAPGMGSTATSMVHLTDTVGLKVTHAYSPADMAPGVLFKDVVTITNMTGGTITDVRFVRVMDWDVPPTEFGEFVTIIGTATTTLLEKSHDNGFNTADPLSDFGPLNGATEDVDFTDDGPDDHGAYFRFNFGDLMDGESYTFTTFYGAAATETAALAAIGAEGIELFSLGQSSGGETTGSPATFIFGFKGVGGTAVIPPPSTDVPEPGTLALLAVGLIGLGAARRKRSA